MKKIAIIGGGAAGLMATVRAAEGENTHVTLFEKNPFCGKKLAITGKGRCNLTNVAPVYEAEQNIPRGAKFLRTALYSFPPEEVMAFFEALGVPLKTERGGRVFPVSDKAKDVVNALTRAALSHKNVTLRKEEVLDLSLEDSLFSVKTPSRTESFDRVLLATGGASYPLTGSTGKGYELAKKLGHEIVPPTPSLIPLVVKEPFCGECMGLSLKNTGLTVKNAAGKTVYEDFGEMLFTHFGVSGPMVLSASAYLSFPAEYRILLDLKPALSFEELDKRVLSDFEENKNRDLVNALDRLLPQKIIRPLLQLGGFDERKKVNLMTRSERQKFVSLLKALPLTVEEPRPLKEAIVTRGGVTLKEVDPKTMESKIVPGLYFAGEILDADALTGGFNLQIAFSTGALAGKYIGETE